MLLSDGTEPVHHGSIRSGRRVAYCQPNRKMRHGVRASNDWKEVTCPDCLARAVEQSLAEDRLPSPMEVIEAAANAGGMTSVEVIEHLLTKKINYG